MPDDELDLYFTKSDLIPAIIQDDDTEEVLMLAYMNREAFRRTLETGYTWFYSRSRKALWNKGETSGHTQQVVSIFSDCDDDTLLLRVKQKGAACHTGSHSCFFKRLRGEDTPKGNKLWIFARALRNRSGPPPGKGGRLLHLLSL